MSMDMWEGNSSKAGAVRALGLACQALGEKYGMEPETVLQLLIAEAGDDEALLRMDWKDLDALFQESQVKGR